MVGYIIPKIITLPSNELNRILLNMLTSLLNIRLGLHGKPCFTLKETGFMEIRIAEFVEPYIHLVVGTEDNFYNFFLKHLYKDQLMKSVLRYVKGKKCRYTQALFNEFSAVFQFPCYFGENWSAFDECINDLEWLPGDSYGLFIDHADQIMTSRIGYILNGMDQFRYFFEIMLDTIQEWTQGRNYDSFPVPPTPFHMIMHCTAKKEKSFRSKLRKAGVNQMNLIYLEGEVDNHYSEVTIPKTKPVMLVEKGIN
jgi:hypothetical protein